MNKIFYELLFLLLLPSTSFAYIGCGSMPVVDLTIQASRDNGSLYANTLRINLPSTGACSDYSFGYLKNTHAAYYSFLSVLGAAQLSGQNVQVYISEAPGIYPEAREIEFIIKP